MNTAGLRPDPQKGWLTRPALGGHLDLDLGAPATLTDGGLPVPTLCRHGVHTGTRSPPGSGVSAVPGRGACVTGPQ